MEYEEYQNDFNETYIIRRNDDGSISYIPAEPANSDYQAYLASLEETAE